MKTFLLKIFMFLGILSIGLLSLYEIFDHEQVTIGDYRYGKVRKIFTSNSKYNTLLIGSSRVINIGDTVVGDRRIYNFGMVNGMPAEYPNFIKFSLETKPIRQVLLGLDFYGSSVDGLKGINDHSAVAKKPEEYFAAVKNETAISSFLSKFELPRFKRLINAILFDNVLPSAQPLGAPTWHMKHWPIYMDAYANFVVNPSIGDTYEDIKTASADGGAELKVFITPVSKPLFELLLQNDLQDEYENFLRLTVATYGTVYNFMEINEFTSSPENFVDENHTTNQRLFEIVKLVSTGEKGSSLQLTELNPAVIEDYIKNKRYLKD